MKTAKIIEVTEVIGSKKLLRFSLHAGAQEICI